MQHMHGLTRGLQMAQYVPVITDIDYGTPWNLVLSLSDKILKSPNVPLEGSALHVHG